MGRDTIAEIITSIRNADMDRKRVVRVVSTNITENIVKILFREGFIENVRKHREKNKYFLVLTLRYRRNRKRPYRNFLNLKQISRPGLRIYSNSQQIPRILGGIGIVILSTSQGIMTNREARLEGIGGEILCYIWEAKPIMKKEQKWIYEGEIAESLPNGMFRVRRLDNEDLVLGYISGKIRCKFIRISLGDKVKIEISRYDSTEDLYLELVHVSIYVLVHAGIYVSVHIGMYVEYQKGLFMFNQVSIIPLSRLQIRGRVISWSSAGTCNFKNRIKGTPFAAQTAAVDAIQTVDIQRAEVMIKGPGIGRDAALRAIRRSGILLTCVRDVTPMPHNGCRPPKKRRI
ncbi:Ribosomal protein S8 [Orobanche minor]